MAVDTEAPPDCVKLVRQDRDNSEAYHKPWLDLIDRELDFSLKLMHYANDTGETKHQSRVQPRGLQTYQIIRHKTSRICSSEPYIEVRALDDQAPPEAAGFAKGALEQVLFNPLTGYKRAKKRMVTGALAARAWGMKVEYDPVTDSILFASQDPTKLFVAPGCIDIHDPRTPFVIEERLMRIDDIKARGGTGENDWKNVDDVKPDGNSERPVRQAQGDLSGAVKLSQLPSANPGNDTTKYATVLFGWYRRDPEDETYEQDDGVRELEPQEQYMECQSCGYKDDSYPRDQDGDLPPLGEECPACNADLMSRVDQVQETSTFIKYPDGVLYIVCPNCDVKLYEGPWPQKLRSFPFILYGAYTHPRDLYGQSDTSLNWSLQTISNFMLRQGWHQIRLNQDVILTPAEGLIDEFGKPFNFSDEQGRIAYFSDPMAATQTKHFQGSGLPTSWATYFNSLEGVFRANMGTSDLGLTPDRSKDIPVGTVRQLTETGEVPTDQHIRDLREEESVLYGVVWDMIRATWTSEKWVRVLGPTGAQTMQSFVGSQMPNFEFMVYGSPSLRSLDLDDFQTLTQWFQMPPPLRAVAAKLLNIPGHYMDEIAQAEQAMQPPPGPPPPPGGPPGAAPPPGGPPPPGGGGGGPPQGIAGIPPPVVPGPTPLPQPYYDPHDIAAHLLARKQAFAALDAAGIPS